MNVSITLRNPLWIATANLQQKIDISKEYFEVVDSEDTAVAYLAALAEGKYLYVPPTSVKIVSQGDTISEFEYRAVGFPHGNIDRVAAVKHSASRLDMYAVHRL